ncbi:helix-turn-helix domain-containing protein [Streptomyces phaeochromogenes]
MQLRYAFRLYPDTGQRTALARAFGCARAVYNDAVRAREDARRAGEAFRAFSPRFPKYATTAAPSTPAQASNEPSRVVPASK